MIYGEDLVRMFSEIENDSYNECIQKQFDEEDSGSGFGTAMLGGAAALGGGFLAAKKGVFGGNARKWAGKTWAKAGKTLGSSSMIRSGMVDAGKGSLTAAGKSYEGLAGKKNLLNEMNAISREEGMNVAKVKGKWQYQKGGATKAEEAVAKKAEDSGAKKAAEETKNQTNTQQTNTQNQQANTQVQQTNNGNKGGKKTNTATTSYDKLNEKDQKAFDDMLNDHLATTGLSGKEYLNALHEGRRTGMINGVKVFSNYTHYKYRYL